VRHADDSCLLCERNGSLLKHFVSYFKAGSCRKTGVKLKDTGLNNFFISSAGRYLYIYVPPLNEDHPKPGGRDLIVDTRKQMPNLQSLYAVQFQEPGVIGAGDLPEGRVDSHELNQGLPLAMTHQWLRRQRL
jgi:hypothetical protein